MLQMFSTATMNLGSCDSAFKPLTPQILTIRKHQSPLVETSNIGRAGSGVHNSRAWRPLSGKMKNICSQLILKKKSTPPCLATSHGDAERRREENRARTYCSRSRSWKDCGYMRMVLLVVLLYYHKSKKQVSMVQKSSVKKDALLPWSPRGRVGGRVFMPSPQSPPPLLQLPWGKERVKRYTKMQVPDVVRAAGGFWCDYLIKGKPATFASIHSTFFFFFFYR